MEEKTKEELDAELKKKEEEQVAAAEVKKKAEAEFETSLEGLSEEERADKIAEKDASDAKETEAEEQAQKDIDELKSRREKLEGKPRDEKEKAETALFHNAERLRELGGDPGAIIGAKKPKEGGGDDIDSKIDRKFAEQEARKLSKSTEEFDLIMAYVNKGLSVEDAHIVANKGRFKRTLTELRRTASVSTAPPASPSHPTDTEQVPERSKEVVDILARRGMHLNPKTGTYQGKYYEEYYDSGTESWKSRKMPKA